MKEKSCKNNSPTVKTATHSGTSPYRSQTVTNYLSASGTRQHISRRFVAIAESVLFSLQTNRSRAGMESNRLVVVPHRSIIVVASKQTEPNEKLGTTSAIQV